MEHHAKGIIEQAKEKNLTSAAKLGHQIELRKMQRQQIFCLVFGAGIFAVAIGLVVFGAQVTEGSYLSISSLAVGLVLAYGLAELSEKFYSLDAKIKHKKALIDSKVWQTGEQGQKAKESD